MRVRVVRWVAVLISFVLCVVVAPHAFGVVTPSDYDIVSVPLGLEPMDCWVNPVTNRVYVRATPLTPPLYAELHSFDGHTLTRGGEIAPGSEAGILGFSNQERVIIAGKGGSPLDTFVAISYDAEVIEYRSGLTEADGYFFGARPVLIDDLNRFVAVTLRDYGPDVWHKDLRVLSIPSLEQIRVFTDVTTRKYMESAFSLLAELSTLHS